MKRKLDLAKAREVQEGKIVTKIELDQTEQIQKLEAVNDTLRDVWQTLNDKEEYDFDKLKNQLEELHKRLDFTPIISGLEELKTSQEDAKNKQTIIKDFSKLLELVEKNKPANIDLTNLEKAIIQVEQRIQEGLVQDQGVDDYQPVRRVVKVGNRLVWDDQPTPSRGGGGGGGSSSGGLTNAELRASPVDVNATIDTSAVATSAKQSDGSQKTQIVDSGGEVVTVTGGKLDVNASIDTTGLATTLTDTNTTDIKTAVEILDNAISGSEMQVDVVAALPAGNNNIGDVDVASLPVAFNTGTRSATTQRVTIATDDSVPVTNAGLTELAASINSNKVDVNIVSSDVATGGTSTADDADFTAGTTPGTIAQGVYESTPTTVTDGDVGAVGITAGRRLKTSATIDAALPAGTNNIGDVDVLSSALPTGASTSAKQDTVIGHLDGVESLLTDIEADTDTLAVVGGGTEAAAQRVTIANDSTGVLSVDDNGGSLTVDGTVAVTNAALTELAAAINTDKLDVNIASGNITGFATSAKQDTAQTALDAIKTATEVIDNAISGSEMQVDVVAALPAGTNAIGKLAANSGVDIGDVDVTSIAAGTNKIGDVDIAPRTTGGWSVGNFTSGDTYTALTATAQVLKASAGKFGGYYIYNPNSAATYVLVYNIAAASVTVGTSTPKLVFCIPATSGANLEILAGIPFDTAMSVAATTTGGGNTAPATALEAMVYYV